MDARSRIEQEAMFERMSKMKTWQRKDVSTLGESLVSFYKSTVQRTRKFAGIGEVWETLVPPDVNEHCCLESYRAGTLTVLVDSSPHMYRVKQLLLGGLQKQMLELCRGQGLRKISLRPGRWYDERGEDRRIMFG
jgi:hypothetical protein